ncbi:MAG: hypothetical protein KA713_03955 [Chryseotalea sp. WA131a]|nr:MAG: hypothetical protein KA713_03955 [Chryseotalea sp. WA131a]
MPKFDEAKYLDRFITVVQYADRLHYQKIFCPECEIASLHYVKKQKIAPYFSSNRNIEHDEDCQHYHEQISPQLLKELSTSELAEDRERFNFLINSGLESALRQMLKNLGNKKTKLTDSEVDLGRSIVSNDGKSIKEAIRRVHITNIRKQDNLAGEYMIIYGNAETKLSTRELINKATGEKFFSGMVTFKSNNSLYFSVLLKSWQLPHFEERKIPINVRFAVFGQLKSPEKKYLNLTIRLVEDFRFLPF